MALAAWGIAILVGYSLLQIPAVLLLARYCEVDAADLPTPPARAFWTDEGPDDHGSTAGGGDRVSDDTPTPDDDQVAGDTLTPGDAVPDDDTAITPAAVRCDHCGEQNDPSFGRCRNCVARL